MKKRIASAVLVLCLATGIFSGCKKDSGNLNPKGDFISIPVGETWKVTPQGEKKLYDFDYGSVTLTDERLLSLYEDTRQLFLNISNDDILYQFRKRIGADTKSGKQLGGWIGDDFFNPIPQWFSAFAKMSKINNDTEMLNKINYLVDEFAKCVKSDGFFMATDNPNAPHYEFEKFVGAMVDVYQYTGNETALSLLETMLNWGLKNLDTSNAYALNATNGATEWYTVPETSYKAYLLTGNKKFKELADSFIAKLYFDTISQDNLDELFIVCENEAKGWYHAYSHLNALSSAAMKYYVDNDADMMKTITSGFSLFRRTQIYPTGGFGPNESLVRENGRYDFLYSTDKHAEIPCGSWAIAKLNKYLTEFTGDGQYGQWWEDMLFNGVGAMEPMRKDGAILYYHNYSPLGAAKVPHNNYSCCTGTYPNSIAELYNQIYYKDEHTIYISQYLSSELVLTQSNSKKMKFVQSADLFGANTSSVTIKLQETSRFRLAFRIPDWSQTATLTVNDKPVQPVAENGYWILDNTWNNGDVVKIKLDPKWYTVRCDSDNEFPVCIKFGPVVMAVKGESIPTFAAEEMKDVSSIVKKEEGSLHYKIALGGKNYDLMPYYDIGENQPYTVTFDPSAAEIAKELKS